MTMDDSGSKFAEEEIERLRNALDAETRRRLDVERRLDRADGEFEEFISIAAHNLRESLRNVASFSQLIAETSAGRLDAEAGAFLERVREGAANMQSLLSSVMDYWTGASSGEEPCRTEMEAVLGQALLCEEKRIAAANATVTHDPLPSVTGHFETLVHVLRHLIRNAVEYAATPAPRVHLSAVREGPDWVFSVQDNGPGIDPEFYTRIFEVFKRLHGREHPGHGLGLAFCKKAVERLGGRIWVESAPGAGSTFFFTLPPAG